jgi:hypothetical protein
MQAISRFSCPTKKSGYPVVSSRIVTFSNKPYVVFLGIFGPRQIRKSGNAVFLEEYEVFWTDFLPTEFWTHEKTALQ